MRNLAPLLLLTLFDSLSFFSLTLADFNEECKEIKTKSASTRLSSYIKCDLRWKSATIRDNKNRTEIIVVMRAELLNFDESDNNLQYDGYFIATWADENLKWNYTSYDDIKTMPIHSREIWTPDIAVLSAGNDNTAEHGFGDVQCTLYYEGKVVCANLVRRKIRCQTDFKLWPYDRQKCILVVTSWAYSSEQINLTTHEEATVFMSMFRSNGEWNYSVSRIFYEQRVSNYYENVSSPQILVEFVMDRLHTHLRGRYVAPAIIMMVMTLITLWLDPKSIERLAIASLNIIIHMMCIQDLHWTLPHNGTTVPNILLFYVNSFVLATVALLFTFLLATIKDTKMSTPKWISSSIALVLSSRAGQFLMLGMLDPKATAGIEAGDTSDLMSSEPKETAWTYVVIFFGWISFLGFFFAYIIMYAILIPSSAAYTPIEALSYYDRVDEQFGVIG